MPPSAPIPFLIAHRGYPARYPENSLDGIRAALWASACYVEFDVQLSADGIPVVIHDRNTLRTAGVDFSVLDTSFQALRRIAVGEPARFGTQFAEARISSLEEIIALLPDWPRATALVEMKRASLKHFGIDAVVAKVMAVLAPVRDRCVLVSFDPDALDAARQAGASRVGWAIEEWEEERRQRAERLAPDYLFCRVDRLPPRGEPLWPGPWRWAAYQTDDPETALALATRGVALIETDSIGEMLHHPLLKLLGCGNG